MYNLSSPGSATIVNAIATGFGAAFGIGLDIQLSAKSIDSGIKCSNDVGADNTLMELTAKKFMKLMMLILMILDYLLILNLIYQ